MSRNRARVSLFDLKPDSGSFLRDVLAGLSLPRKALSPKYFYDERGSALFEAICELPEYYPTRTEMAIMRAHVGEMAERLGPDCLLIEYGSGSGRKTRVLIAALAPVSYMPIDIAREQLTRSAAELEREFPGLQILAVCTDYSRPLALPAVEGTPARRRVVYFPGSTIGNFELAEARQFLRGACAMVGPGGAMLVGVDLKKDEALLNAAYNDAQGVTAAFNLNLLTRINRELGADFDPGAFHHRAFYNVALSRIEMHLVSEKRQSVTIAGHRFEFAAGETIHTENSCKYSVDEFQALAGSTGFVPEHCWTDPAQLFAVHYLAVA